VCELPLSVAAEELTGWEVLDIQGHFKQDMDDLGTVKLLIGAVWVYECRRTGTKVPWGQIKSMALKTLSGYFAAEPDDPDTADELGKDASPTGD
jgi:hypothetical protein